MLYYRVPGPYVRLQRGVRLGSAGLDKLINGGFTPFVLICHCEERRSWVLATCADSLYEFYGYRYYADLVKN